MLDKMLRLRCNYHAAALMNIVFLKANDPSMADCNSRLSLLISHNLIKEIRAGVGPALPKRSNGPTAFEDLTRGFLQNASVLISPEEISPWNFHSGNETSKFSGFEYLAPLAANSSLKKRLGDYVITPDIIVARRPVTDSDINRQRILAKEKTLPSFTPLRSANNAAPTLHASISCKWTIRSDRSQNARTEGLNLIRNRKGHTPHIVVLTGEPMPTRIASLALGTGDIDCVYHFALHELVNAVNETKNEAAIDALRMMVEGRRLRDISDLPFDLAL
jgi:NgoMIV restriction enzyme